MSDIVERLRGWVYTGPLYATAQEAADEIERLRHRVRFSDAVIRSGNVAALTDAEREAVEWAAEAAESEEDGGRPTDAAGGCEYSIAMRGLLLRLKGER